MDPELRQRMLAYYDERAPEYEDAYRLGTGTASIRDPEVFKAEVPVLARVAAAIGQGRLIDLACGTAYWLPHYAANCSGITLFDQSSRMLAEARAKADALGITERCVFLQATSSCSASTSRPTTRAGRLLPEPSHRGSGAAPVRCASESAGAVRALPYS